MFVFNNNELNHKQIAAIEKPDNVFLVACPGSGKTRTLTYKIAFELSKKENVEKRVVAITYTRKAADEIHDRIVVLDCKIIYYRI